MGQLLPLQNKWKHNSGKIFYYKIQEAQFLTLLSAVNQTIYTQGISVFLQKLQWN